MESIFALMKQEFTITLIEPEMALFAHRFHCLNSSIVVK